MADTYGAGPTLFHAFVQDGTLMLRMIDGGTLRQWALSPAEVGTLEQAIATWKAWHPHA